MEIHDAERPYVLATVSLSQLADYSIGRHVRVAFEGTPTRKPLEGVVADLSHSEPRNAASRSSGTFQIASSAIRADIFESPALRSRNVIGTSSTRSPRASAR